MSVLVVKMNTAGLLFIAKAASLRDSFTKRIALVFCRPSDRQGGFIAALYPSLSRQRCEAISMNSENKTGSKEG